ncbi:MAG: hypothetical protein AB7G93_13430 [Bdellovibrionales bacterium]
MAEVSEEAKLKMRQKLKSLGCAFGIEFPSEAADLEKTILECLPYYWRYNDFFFMCFSALKLQLHSLVNVDRLVSLAEKASLTNDELCLLLAVSQRMVDLNDLRFEQVIENFRKSGLRVKTIPRDEDDPHLISQWGVEKSLEPYGVRVRAFYEEAQKKFYVLDGILKNNEWLRIRSKIGANFKADVAYFKISGKATSATEAARLAGCTLQEAKRHWKALAHVSRIDNLVA